MVTYLISIYMEYKLSQTTNFYLSTNWMFINIYYSSCIKWFPTSITYPFSKHFYTISLNKMNLLFFQLVILLQILQNQCFLQYILQIRHDCLLSFLMARNAFPIFRYLILPQQQLFHQDYQ